MNKVKDLAVAYKSQPKIYTYEDLLKTPEDGKRYEIIQGELVVSGTPYVIHQIISQNIVFALHGHVKKNDLGQVYFAPVDVVLSEINVVEPDILFISKQNLSILTEENIQGAPDLVIEVLSPSTAYYDLIGKKEIYEHYGILEYWIVDPKRKALEVLQSKNRKFELTQKLEREGSVNSGVLQNLSLTWGEIFAC